jgi:hypothetical protein
MLSISILPSGPRYREAEALKAIRAERDDAKFRINRNSRRNVPSVKLDMCRIVTKLVVQANSWPTLT